MNAAEILHTLTDQGFTLGVEGDRLTVNPSSKLTDAMRAEIRAHKADLIACLTQAANDDPDRHQRWLVRHPDGLRESIWYDPPKTAAEVMAIYPGAEIEPEPKPGFARPVTGDARVLVNAWLDHIGEDDAEIRREFLYRLARDAEQLRLCLEDARAAGLEPDPTPYDSGRRTCRQCRNLEADGGCRAARRGQIPNASKHYTWPAGIDDPHRCVGYQEGRP